MRSPLRIAVLECDEPIGHTREKYGGYGNLFKELLENGAREIASADSGVRPELDVTKFNVVNHELYPSLDNVDAVLVTGSSRCPPATVVHLQSHGWLIKLSLSRVQQLRQ